MILSDKTIKELIDSKQIIILPEFSHKDIRPVGIRLHLGHEILLPKPEQTVDLSGTDGIDYEKIVISDDGYILKPNQFILGTSYERFQVPRDIVCYIEGRSTIARLGLSIHCTSGIIDGNFDDPRTVVFEMKNIGPTNLIIKPKLALAMLTFSKLSATIEQNSQEQYKGQNGVVAPNLKVQKK
jgi:dCTP deaminase